MNTSADDDDSVTECEGDDAQADSNDEGAAALDEVSAADGAPRSLRAPALALVLAVVVLAGLTGWLGYGALRDRQATQQRETFLAVGRQVAVDLTTIDWQQAESDVQRILDSATGGFHDDFSKRAQPFIEAVKESQSKSTGAVTEAALESESSDAAQAIVAVSVSSTTPATPQPAQRSWRMRISLQRNGNETKVSGVEFVA